MKSFGIIAIIGYIGFHFSDVRSGSLVGTYLAPLLLFGAIVAFFILLKHHSMKRTFHKDDCEKPFTISSSDFD